MALTGQSWAKNLHLSAPIRKYGDAPRSSMRTVLFQRENRTEKFLKGVTGVEFFGY